MTLFERLKKLLNIDESIAEMDEITVQLFLAKRLRKLAIEHLAEGKGVVAEGLRGEYIKAGLGHHKPYLEKQSRNGVWATDIEAAALGELLGCTVMVKLPKDESKQAGDEKQITAEDKFDIMCLYRAPSDKAPVIELTNNRNNTHWWVNNKTLGDGNCLFNAFAQALQSQVRKELPAKQSWPARATLPQEFFHHEEEVVKHQQKIIEAIKKHPTPAQLEDELKREKARIQQLSPQEQQQIIDDHKLALQLAREEFQSFNNKASIFALGKYREQAASVASTPLFAH